MHGNPMADEAVSTTALILNSAQIDCFLKASRRKKNDSTKAVSDHIRAQLAKNNEKTENWICCGCQRNKSYVASELDGLDLLR